MYMVQVRAPMTQVQRGGTNLARTAQSHSQQECTSAIRCLSAQRTARAPTFTIQCSSPLMICLIGQTSIKLSWLNPAKLGLRFMGRSSILMWSHSPDLASLNTTCGQPYTNRSESSVMTKSTKPLFAKYAICASASYGATMNSTPAAANACSSLERMQHAARHLHAFWQ